MLTLLPPNFSGKRQLIQLCACLPPRRIVFMQNQDELVAVHGFDKVHHLMHYYIFDQIFWFLDQFGVQPDVSRLVVVASPLCFHAS